MMHAALPLRPGHRDAPIQRLVLHVALAELEGGLRLHQLGAEIERMRPIGRDTKPGIELERIVSNVMSVAVIDVDSVLGHFNAEIRIADGFRGLLDLLGRGRDRLAIAQAGKPSIDANGQPAQ